MLKSPFPGMNPYLEAHWGDIHTRLMVYSANQLNAQLPPDLQTQIEEGVSVGEYGDRASRTVYPDVQVVERSTSAVGQSAEFGGSTAVILAEPFVIALDDDPRTGRHLEIVDVADGGRLVTVIKFLSPANKVGADGQLQYIRKQREYLAAGVNLVEIDLIRSGKYILAAPENRLPTACRGPYLACVRGADRFNEAVIYAIGLRSPLPGISVPLRSGDRPVVLDLQELIDACYRDGRYDRIDYLSDPVPRLGESDAQWLDALLRDKGLRS
jgi:hypothetical protein